MTPRIMSGWKVQRQRTVPRRLKRQRVLAHQACRVFRLPARNGDGLAGNSRRLHRTRLEEHLMIGFIVAGLVIGLLARLLLPGRQRIGLLWTLLLGVVGAVVGGTVANLLGTGDVMELNVVGFIVAVVAAVALLSAAERAGLGAGADRGRLGHG
jgi:uncharacterized membrane protein YeaQ/YmgE (transglycosylase-associated protein family)